MPAHLLAFLGVSLLLIVTPGQDMALVLRNTLGGGRRSGVATAFGVVSGLLVWVIVASVGLTALLLASHPIFTALKIGGALYLVFLGVQSLRSALGSGAGGGHGPGHPVAARLTDRTAFRQGLVSNLGNPKIAIFFSSLLPQFVGGDGASFSALLALGLLFCALGLIWLTSYAVILDRAGAYLRRSTVRRAIEAVTGFVLIGLAVRLATARR